jgi:hypothetical protein
MLALPLFSQLFGWSAGRYSSDIADALVCSLLIFTDTLKEDPTAQSEKKVRPHSQNAHLAGLRRHKEALHTIAGGGSACVILVQAAYCLVLYCISV